MVFSQNETLCLQKRVTELEKTSYVDVITKDLKSEALAKNIKDRFDAEFDPLQRNKPVQNGRVDFVHNRRGYNSMFGMPWRCMYGDPLLEIISSELQKCIMKAPSKETRENWATEQTDIILNSVLFAFTGAYDMASVYDLQNELVTNKELQESIFWKAMYDCIVVTDILDKYCLYLSDESDQEQ